MNASSKLLQNPILWILFFLLIRGVGLLNPPIETGHNWRQVTGLMVSRNFLEVDPSILHPRVDDNRGESGIIGMEFPLMNYIYFGMAKLFGYQHWYGRLIALVFSAIGSFYFFRILRLYFPKRLSLFALILLSTSIWFSFSRKMMPDVFCISLYLVGLYHALRYLQSGAYKHLGLFGLFGALAILSKIPAVIFTGALIPFFFQKSISPRQKLSLTGVLALQAILVYLWYFWWCPHLSETYGSWFNLGKTWSEGWSDIQQNLAPFFKNFYFHSLNSYLGIVLALFGLGKAISLREKKLLWPIAFCFTLFLMYAIRSGFYFHHHNYYIIPIVPVIALLAAYGLYQLPKKKIAIALLALISIEGVANQQHDFFIKKSQAYKMELESISERIIPPKSLVVINIPDNPQQLYFSHRKGWLSEESKLQNPVYIDSLIQKGCSYLIIDRNFWNGESPDYPLLFESENYQIHHLKK